MPLVLHGFPRLGLQEREIDRLLQETAIRGQEIKAQVEAIYNEAMENSAARRWNEAITQFKELLELDPRHKEARNGLKQAYIAQGKEYSAAKDWHNAINSFEQAKRIDPWDPEIARLLQQAIEKSKLFILDGTQEQKAPEEFKAELRDLLPPYAGAIFPKPIGKIIRGSPEKKLLISADKFIEYLEVGAEAFQFVKVTGPIYLRTAQLPTKAVNGDEMGRIENTLFFFETEFEDGVYFRDTVFENRVVFSSCTFHSIAEFNNITFEGEVHFAYCTFKNGGSFDRVKFLEKCLFSSVNFRDGIGFRRSLFNSETTFSNVAFDKGAAFAGTSFNGYTVFSSTSDKRLSVGGPFTFYATTCDKPVYFQRVEFLGDLMFGGVRDKKELNCVLNSLSIIDSVFHNQVKLQDIDVREQMMFNITEFQKGTEFSGLRFRDGGEFAMNGVTCLGDLKFSENRFCKFHLVSGKFGKLRFETSEFNGSHDSVKLQGLQYEQLYIDWELISNKIYYDKTTFYILEDNYRKLGRFDEADLVYYSRWEQKRQKADRLDWLCYGLWWFVGGYGVKPQNVIYPSGLITFICLIVFWLWPEGIEKGELFGDEDNDVSVWGDLRMNFRAWAAKKLPAAKTGRGKIGLIAAALLTESQINDRIEVAAYVKYIERGQRPGDHITGWLEAEKEAFTLGGRIMTKALGFFRRRQLVNSLIFSLDVVLPISFTRWTASDKLLFRIVRFRTVAMFFKLLGFVLFAIFLVLLTRKLVR